MTEKKQPRGLTSTHFKAYGFVLIFQYEKLIFPNQTVPFSTTANNYIISLKLQERCQRDEGLPNPEVQYVSVQDKEKNPYFLEMGVELFENGYGQESICTAQLKMLPGKHM